MASDIFEQMGQEPLGETSAAFDFENVSMAEALLALQFAMAREGGNRSQTITDLPIGPDLYTVKFGVGEAEFIQERHDMGPHYALQMIDAGRWTVKLLGDVIYAGLTGGGLKPEQARQVVERNVYKRPWLDSAKLAQVILQAGVVGVPDEPTGKAEGEASQETPTSPVERSASPLSTDTPA